MTGKKILIFFICFVIILLTSLFSFLLILTNYEAKMQTISLKNGENKIHGLIYVNGYIFASTHTIPAKIFKIDSENLNNYKTLTFPNDGKHNFADSIIYVKTKNMIYLTFAGKRVNISEINPENLSFSDINNIPIEAQERTSPVITTDGEYLYVFSFTKIVKIHKISLKDLKEKSSKDLPKLAYAHSAIFDGNYIYSSGVSTPSWIAKINPVTLTYIYQPLLVRDGIITDDMSQNNEYIFICSETKDKNVLRVDKNNLSKIDRINKHMEAPCYGVYFDGHNVLAVYGTSPGSIIKIEPKSLMTKLFSFEKGKNVPNEIISNGKYYFFSFWQFPAIIDKVPVASFNN